MAPVQIVLDHSAETDADMEIALCDELKSSLTGPPRYTFFILTLHIKSKTHYYQPCKAAAVCRYTDSFMHIKQTIKTREREIDRPIGAENI